MFSKLFRLATLSSTIIVVVGTTLCAQAANSLASCSITTLHDRYGYTIDGASNGVPILIVGQFATDGTGSLAGSETINQNGSVAEVATLGSYTLRDNCTGTLEIDAPGAAAMHFDIAVTAGAAEIELVGNDSAGTLSGTAQATATPACSLLGLHGMYSLRASGTEIGKGPIAMAGKIKVLANGLLQGAATVNRNGVISSSVPISGVYKIGKQCFGAAEISLGNEDRTIFLDLIVVKNQKEILFIDGEANSFLSGSWQQ